MHRLKSVFAALAGLVAGVLAVATIQFVSSRFYPMPANLDVNDSQALGEWIKQLPLGAYLFVLASWASGTFVGVLVARVLTVDRRAWAGCIVWALMAAATIITLVSLPHPLWFWFAGILVCLVFGLFGLLVAAPKQYVVRASRQIIAPVGRVFRTLSQVDEFSRAVPDIVRVEFLTDQHFGVGTRFRETRVMRGREATTELHVAELEDNRMVRMVSEMGGTIWDTTFTVDSAADGTQMTMHMDCRPCSLMSRFMVPMILPLVDKAVQGDMDAIKAYCEKPQ
ncbi:MAG: SRPBCC family protein [Planctomycetales bacterium]|nr:SRPBCC family protein [Planctomycetales bacterium]